jgi:hypothetical protein
VHRAPRDGLEDEQLDRAAFEFEIDLEQRHPSLFRSMYRV